MNTTQRTATRTTRPLFLASAIPPARLRQKLFRKQYCEASVRNILGNVSTVEISASFSSLIEEIAHVLISAALPPALSPSNVPRAKPRESPGRDEG